MSLFAGAASASEDAAPPVPPDVKRYAPLLVLQDDERYGLASADSFIASASLRWSDFAKDTTVVQAGGVDARRLGVNCTQVAVGCYRHRKWVTPDFTRPHDGNRSRVTRGGNGFYLDASNKGRQGTAGAPVYFERTTTAITYWFFYAYSYPGKVTRLSIPLDAAGHEGDWERIKVTFGGSGSPTEVTYHQHDKSAPISWLSTCRTNTTAARCQRDGAHPVVFVAKGSHASYPRAGLTDQCWAQLLCSVDIHREGQTRATWQRSLRNVTPEPWYGFGGAWGRVSRFGKHFTGPLGPSAYKP